MQKTLLSLLITASSLLLSACQPPSEKTDTPDPVTSAQTDKKASTPTLIEARTAKELTTSIVELSEGKLRDQLNAKTIPHSQLEISKSN
jgi:protein involved in sex pheromone biosynthesis